MAGGPLDPVPYNAFDRWARVTYRGLGYLGGLLLAVMTLAVFAQVIIRYSGFAGIDGLDEVPRYLFVWLVMIGAAAAMQRGEHTRLEYFVERMGPRAGALVSVVVNGAAILFFCRFSARAGFSCRTRSSSPAPASTCRSAGSTSPCRWAPFSSCRRCCETSPCR